MEEEDSVGEAEEGESGQEEVDVDQGEVEEEETEDEAAELAGLNRWEEQMEIREGGVFYFFFFQAIGPAGPAARPTGE